MGLGYIKLHRCIQDDEFWLSEPFNKAQAWVDLLLLANYHTSSFYIRGNEVEVGRGQLARSEKFFCERWRWSREKVRNFFKLLEKTGKIIQQKSRIISIYTIVKYDEYQETGQQTGQQTGQRTKKVKKEKKLTPIVPFQGDEEKFDPVAYCVSLGADEQDAIDWVTWRKKGKWKKETTKRVVNYLKGRADKCNISFSEAVNICANRQWLCLTDDFKPNEQQSIFAGGWK